MIHLFIRWIEQSLTSIRLPSLDEENGLENQEKENKSENNDIEKVFNEADSGGDLVKRLQPRILILLLLILLLLLLFSAGLAIHLRKDTKSTPNQILESLTTDSIIGTQPTKEEELPTEESPAISFDATIGTSTKLVLEGTTYFPDPPPRAGSQDLPPRAGSRLLK